MFRNRVYLEMNFWRAILSKGPEVPFFLYHSQMFSLFLDGVRLHSEVVPIINSPDTMLVIFFWPNYPFLLFFLFFVFCGFIKKGTRQGEKKLFEMEPILP